jgi:hypothetical protein
MKLMINGYSRHGKDAFADILVKEYNFKKKDASMIIARDMIRMLPYQWYGKCSFEEQAKRCYEDRVNRREFWNDYIEEYGCERLTFECLDGGDLRVGLRRLPEFKRLKQYFDATVWVEATRRISNYNPEPWLTVKKSDHDFVINNNGDLEQLREQARCLMSAMLNR